MLKLKVFRRLGSLQMAVTLLPTLAGVLFVGVLLESWYSEQVARKLIYATWWFAALLGLLGVNVLCAALKKWPWRRHQTGFLITHLGLITLVIGGLLDSLTGVRATVVLVDSPSSQANVFGPQTTRWAVDRHADFIQVICSSGNGRQNPAEIRGAPFRPGAVAWDHGPLGRQRHGPLGRQRHGSLGRQRTRRSAGGLQSPWLLRLLDRLANPLSTGWRTSLPGGAELEVTAYYPHTKREPFSTADSGRNFHQTGSFPALKFQLASAIGGILPAQWVALTEGRQTAKLGPGLVEMLAGDCHHQQIEQFLHPPTTAERGEKGQLVITHNSRIQRIDVAQSLGQQIRLFDGSLERPLYLRITHYTPNYRQDGDPLPSDPALTLQIVDGPTTGKRRKASFAVSARRAGRIYPLTEDEPEISSGGGRDSAPKDRPLKNVDLKNVRFWYHPPDPRYGDVGLRAALQFAVTNQGRWYWRSFTSAGGSEFRFESGGELHSTDDRVANTKQTKQTQQTERTHWRPIWQGMDWRFRVVDRLDQAIAEPRFTPLKRRLGMVDEKTPPAIRCRLRRGGRRKEFWVGKTPDDRWTTVQLGSDVYQVGFHPLLLDLGFELTLARAEQTTDPGSSRPASQSSYVLLTDPANRLHEAPRVITMNEPLGHRGFKLYQANYEELGRDDRGKLISRSALTVGRDPGLACKYAGSVMVALGIACMFYMRAYFFKPRRAPANRWGSPAAPLDP